MKLKNLTVALIVIVSSMQSCSSEDVKPIHDMDEDPIQKVIEFTNLEVGNYWVYEWYEIESDGKESNYNVRDSLFVEKDTVISNREYLVRSGTFLGSQRREILFDSANSIFRYPSRELLFTLDETIEFIATYGPKDNQIATTTYSLDNTPSTISVPVGNFECIDYKGLTESLEPDYPHGIRVNSHFYSEGTGLILMQTQFYSSPNELEMRLVKNGSN